MIAILLSVTLWSLRIFSMIAIQMIFPVEHACGVAVYFIA